MTAQDPSVSVLMTAYKGNEHFLPAVRSILDQTYSDLELLIVLDPHDEDICREQVQKLGDERIRLIENREREGLVRSRNKGLRASRGRYIAIMDSDDISERDRLQKEVDFLEEHPDHAMVGSPCNIIDGEGRTIKKGEALPATEQLYYNLLFANQFPHSSVMYRREVIDKVGAYNEELSYGEDYDLYLRIMEHGRVHMISEALVSWRHHRASYTSTLTDSMRESISTVMKKNIERKLGISVPEEALHLYIDHSIRGLPLGSVLSSLKTLERINSRFVERSDDWMDRNVAGRIARKKYLSLLTGQVVSNRNLTSIALLMRNIKQWPGLLLHVLGKR